MSFHPGNDASVLIKGESIGSLPLGYLLGPHLCPYRGEEMAEDLPTPPALALEEIEAEETLPERERGRGRGRGRGGGGGGEGGREGGKAHIVQTCLHNTHAYRHSNCFH